MNLNIFTDKNLSKMIIESIQKINLRLVFACNKLGNVLIMIGLNKQVCLR